MIALNEVLRICDIAVTRTVYFQLYNGKVVEFELSTSQHRGKGVILQIAGT